MRKRLYRSLSRRIDLEIMGNHKIKFAKEADLERLIDEAIIPIAYLYTRDQRGTAEIYLIDMVSAMGKRAMRVCGQKKNSPVAVKLGSFLLYSLEELELLHVYKGSNSRHRHACYKVEVLNDRVITELWKELPSEPTGKMPSLSPYAPWESGFHENGAKLIKTLAPGLLETLNPVEHPFVFGLVNKNQRVGWKIFDLILELQKWAFDTEESAFNDIWKAPSKEARSSKLRETEAIIDMAERMHGHKFHHQYNYDFRGRVYPSTAYLHEQGADQAKSLLLRYNEKQIGEEGFYWLMISLATLWGGDTGDGRKTDKIPLEERFEWALANEEKFIEYATTPKIHKGWMRADKPWQFIASCLEFKRFLDCGADYKMTTGLLCWIDGSNNGSQHLAALSRDEQAAPYVNLVPLEAPGDLYAYVAEKAWATIEEQMAEFSEDELERLNAHIDEVMAMKQEIEAAVPRSDDRKLLVEQLRVLKVKDEFLKNNASPVFWSRITHPGDRRKICKRGTMTLPYGGTPYGLGEQVIKDASKHGIELLRTMEHRWGAWMGRLIFQSCEEALVRSMQLLVKFKEAGAQAEARSEFLSWTVPATNFPVIQYYIEGYIRKTWVQYGEPEGEVKSTGYFSNTFQLNVSCLEEPKMSLKKQGQGAAPNIIHSLDAAHLSIVVNAADFAVSTVHDSFGCCLCDMPKLFDITREAFVGLYSHDPLDKILSEVGSNTEGLDIGDYNVVDILQSEYAFA
jgi:DNA-directed RNA polymerase